MRQLTNSEREAMETPLREYWIQKDGLLPKETRAFEAGFIIGLDHSAARLAALTAERDGLATRLIELRAENERLRAACESALDWLVRFSLHSPVAFGGEAELGDELTEALARRALEPPTT